VDPETRTIGVIVAVDEPYGKVRPGVRPPLVKNMFVEVEVRGRPKPKTLVVPRAALQGGKIYVANGDDRLEIREVKIGFTQTNFATIETGLKEGERVVMTDLVPAIEGMLLVPVMDEAALNRLLAEAAGTTGVR
jgi:multidrug efflux pump subunit AcrA (membrane-fusion protein)